MTAFLIEVPAQVQHESHVQNGVTVQGGSNWDLSRSAVETPISPWTPPASARTADDAPLSVTPYEPQHRMPGGEPDQSVLFAANSSVLTAAAQKALREIPRSARVVIAGHADPDEKSPKKVASDRASKVAAYLKRNGRKVETYKSFSDELPVTLSPFDSNLNRRVEIFVK